MVIVVILQVAMFRVGTVDRPRRTVGLHGALPSHWVLDLQGRCLLQVVEIIYGTFFPWKGVALDLTIVPTG